MMAISGSYTVNRDFEDAPSDNLNTDPLPGLLSFKDIPEWVNTYFESRPWLVSDKGDHLSTVAGNHMELLSLDRRDPNIYLIHEDFINGWLRHRSVIHFNVWDSDEYGHETEEDEQ